MAKLKGKAKAAFVARMARGRKGNPQTAHRTSSRVTGPACGECRATVFDLTPGGIPGDRWQMATCVACGHSGHIDTAECAPSRGRKANPNCLSGDCGRCARCVAWESSRAAADAASDAKLTRDNKVSDAKLAAHIAAGCPNCTSGDTFREAWCSNEYPPRKGGAKRSANPKSRRRNPSAPRVFRYTPHKDDLQYIVVTDDHVTVLVMRKAVSGWNVADVRESGHEAWGGAARDEIVAFKKRAGGLGVEIHGREASDILAHIKSGGGRTGNPKARPARKAPAKRKAPKRTPVAKKRPTPRGVKRETTHTVRVVQINAAEVQSVALKKAKFTKSKAAAWCRAHGFSDKHYGQSTHFHVFQQASRESFRNLMPKSMAGGDVAFVMGSK